MAVDGWSPDGTPRLFCGTTPGGGGDVEFIPNVFLGYPWSQTQPPSPSLPSITPGTSDFSLEVWARRKLGSSIDDQFVTGIMEDNSGLPVIIAVISWDTSPADTVRAQFDALGAGVPSLISTGSQSPTRLGRWSHYVANFDRNANMELFIDTDSKETVSISAQADSVTGEVHALTADHVDPYHGTSFSGWPEEDNIFPVIIGPMAIHNRLMTNAEIQDSYRNRKVQNISNVSFINFDWRKIEGQTGWDTDWSRMMLGHKFALPVPAGAPQGAAGTVSVRDQSGSGNHWTIPSVADYLLYDAPTINGTEIEDGLWPMPFGVDPFFG